MASAIHEVRALLVQFERLPLRDLYWRGPEWSVFMARANGSANPMLAVGEPEAAAVPSIALTAPHLGLFQPGCVVGEAVPAGALIGVIDVLGRKTEVVSTTAGCIVSICAASSGLVEFGDRLVEITPA